ncbi:unnamed protein product [Pleuronectes platessa]|uniref:Uncharacterized protein n=1 Tax=Pleuronectes platessa TaxID=8262 RepID=A0A9N7YR87_PLEPL|nr:unnamed protein product [Pleuronectes platessa]
MDHGEIWKRRSPEDEGLLTSWNTQETHLLGSFKDGRELENEGAASEAPEREERERREGIVVELERGEGFNKELEQEVIAAGSEQMAEQPSETSSPDGSQSPPSGCIAGKSNQEQAPEQTTQEE